jgi:hypothetical protein
VAKDERNITEDEVRAEHLGEVHVGRHWAYLGAVLAGGVLLMIALIAALGASAG